MAAMRDDLCSVIGNAASQTVAEYDDGTRLVKSLDADVCEGIATAVLEWLKSVPVDGWIAENYEAGLYSRRNIEAFIDDIEDHA